MTLLPPDSRRVDEGSLIARLRDQIAYLRRPVAVRIGEQRTRPQLSFDGFLRLCQLLERLATWNVGKNSVSVRVRSESDAGCRHLFHLTPGQHLL